MVRTLVVLLLALVGSAAASAGASAGTVESSANPVRRVVTLLQNMAKKVADEGAKEAELFDKYQCFCQNAGGDLAQSIADNDAKVPQLQSDIEAGEAELVRLKQELKAHQEDRAAANSAMQEATSQREGEHKTFLEASGEYKSNVDAMAKSIDAISKGMSGSFLQSAVGAQVRKAIASDNSVTDDDRQMVTVFLGGGSASGAEYVPAGGEIVGILKGIKENFEKSLAQVTSDEDAAAKVFDGLIVAKKKQVKSLTDAIEKKTVRMGDLQVGIVTMKNQLTTSQAALVEDQKFAADLGKNCAAKTAEFDERKKTRGEELVAIHETIKILNDDDALELFKKTLPSPSLLQVQASKAQVQRTALALVRSLSRKAGRPQLDFLAVALSGKKVDFTKVIKMIDDMVALLAQEQADDDNKREYCTTQFDATEDKIKELTKSVDDLETSIADRDEALGALTADLKALAKGVKELDKSVKEATEQRKDENEEYKDLMSSDAAAKELLGYAKNRLNKFYNPRLYKAPAKRELTEEERIFTANGGELAPTAAPGGIAGTGVTALVQISQHVHRDAPEAAPATWEGGVKKSEESSGVIAMVDLLVKDLDKEMTEAEADEKNAQKDYEDMMDDSAKKRAGDLKSIAGKEKAKADAEEGKLADVGEKDTTSKELKATHMYDMQLHNECDWLMQNFDLRKSARAEETSNLKNAKAVLAGADFSLVQAPRHLRGA